MSISLFLIIPSAPYRPSGSGWSDPSFGRPHKARDLHVQLAKGRALHDKRETGTVHYEHDFGLSANQKLQCTWPAAKGPSTLDNHGSCECKWIFDCSRRPFHICMYIFLDPGTGIPATSLHQPDLALIMAWQQSVTNALPLIGNAEHSPGEDIKPKDIRLKKHMFKPGFGDIGNSKWTQWK